MRRLLPVAVILPLAACGGGAAPDGPKFAPVGMANPASVYCDELGGRLEIRAEQGGEAGYCHLPDGSVVEEWQLYRSKTDL